MRLRWTHGWSELAWWLIRRAALEELGAVGYGSFTNDSLAARAGVGKSAIYRHRPDKVDLIADALETCHEQMVLDITPLPPRERIRLLIRHVAEVFADSTFSICIPALIERAERDLRLREFQHR